MVCFPKRILHNRLLDPSASRWQFCILGCAQVRLNGGCHWDIDNSKSAGCVVSVEATMCMSITTPGKECSQWLILPLEVPSFHPFTDRSYLLSGNSQPALLVRPLSNIAAQLLNWGARLLASGWCLQGQQTRPSVQPVLRTRPLLPVAFFISPCRWTAFPGLALPAPPCPTACLKRYLTLPSCPFGWSALVSMPLTFQAGNGFSFLRGCYAALTAWLGVGRGMGEGCHSFWIASWLSGMVRCWRSSWTLQFTNSEFTEVLGVFLWLLIKRECWLFEPVLRKNGLWWLVAYLGRWPT